MEPCRPLRLQNSNVGGIKNIIFIYKQCKDIQQVYVCSYAFFPLHIRLVAWHLRKSEVGLEQEIKMLKERDLSLFQCGQNGNYNHV